MENVKGNDSLERQNATLFTQGTTTQVTKSTDANTTSSKTVHEVNAKYATCIYFLFALYFSIFIKIF